jgi:hypothetical protein
MSQSGARVFPKHILADEMGTVSSGACDGSQRRLKVHDVRGPGDPMTDIRPKRWGANRNGIYIPSPAFQSWNPSIDGEEDPNHRLEIPWSSIPGMHCDPAAVLLEG